MNRDIAPLVGRLATITDRQAANVLPEAAAADLADRITRTAATAGAVAAAASNAPATPAERKRHSPRVVIGLPLAAAGVACAAVAVAVVTRDDGPGTAGRAPEAIGTVRSPDIKLAAALTITRRGDHINVRVRDPLADPKRYRAELAARGIKVRLSLVPASPSIVGTVVMLSTSDGTTERDIATITAKGECETGGGGDRCPVGVRISVGYKGTADVVFARAARQGEQYASSAPVTAPGEAMHGLAFRNHRVGEVLAALRKRKVTVPEYRSMVGNESRILRPAQVPPTWYVRDAVPWAKDQVLLFVEPEPSTPGD